MANSHTQSVLWRGLTHFANGMLFLLWNGADAAWIDFAIAPDRKTVYVLTEVTASTGSVINSIRALDTRGKLLRWRQLREVKKLRAKNMG